VPDHIRRGEMPGIEVHFLAARGITSMELTGGVEPTTLGDQQSFPIFRLTD
jgi:hypothetical protein